MRFLDVLKESTPVYTEDGTQVAVKSSRGVGNPQRVTMLVSKEQWEDIKNQSANTEDKAYDVATAGSIIQDWESQGHEIYWKTAADYNQEARDLENHRFRNDPDVSAHFDAGIDNARGNARSTMKSNLRAVESMDNKTFKEYLMEFGGERNYDAHQAMTQDAERAKRQVGLQRNVTPDQEKAAAPKPTGFTKTPVVNDIIQAPSGNFIVDKNEMGVLTVRRTGDKSGKLTKVPDTYTYEYEGKNQNNKDVFKLVKK